MLDGVFKTYVWDRALANIVASIVGQSAFFGEFLVGF